MKLKQKRQNAEHSAALLVIVMPLILVIIVTLSVSLQRWHLYSERIEDTLPLIARLEGLTKQQDTIAEHRVRTFQIVAASTYGPEQDSQHIVGQLQALARDRVVAAGMSLSGTRQHPPYEDAPFERISVTIEAEGHLPQLTELLGLLRREEPLVIIDQVRIMPGLRGARAEQAGHQRLGFSARISVLRRTS